LRLLSGFEPPELVAQRFQKSIALLVTLQKSMRPEWLLESKEAP